MAKNCRKGTVLSPHLRPTGDLTGRADGQQFAQPPGGGRYGPAGQGDGFAFFDMNDVMGDILRQFAGGRQMKVK